jgi:carboxypeptidase C (cathepsin A)
MAENETEKQETKAEEKPAEAPKPVEKKHKLKLGTDTLNYTTTTGMMPLKNEKGETEANIFFMAYTLDGVKNKAERPLSFVFNGGPGSASVWLHLGAVGPKRVVMQEGGWMPQPPYRLEDNPHTWLDQSDLVFIDPVGTGYSRAVKPEDNKKYWSLQSDLDSVAEFIRLYLGQYQRWTSPLFLAGESYGTTRAAGLSSVLFDKGIALNGIMLISTILNFQTARFAQGNDLPFALFLPTYATTAWYHKRLAQNLQDKPLAEFAAEVEDWAGTEYTLALMQGDKLSEAERANVVEKLSRYTGLDQKYIEGTRLRINIHRFCKELLREENRHVGRLDSRFKGYSELAITEFPDFDPSLTAITPPYTATFNQYVREVLAYENEIPYEILSFNVNRNWEYEKGEVADTSGRLRQGLERNPFMKVLVAQGYYDLATPHYAAHYTMNHSGITPDLHQNFRYTFYEAGHMFYLDVPSLEKLKADVSEFYSFALPK